MTPGPRHRPRAAATHEIVENRQSLAGFRGNPYIENPGPAASPMPVIIRKENPELARVIIELKKAAKAHQAPIWGAAAARLARPRHQAFPLNVGHLERLAEPKETIVVAGKLLAEGNLTKALTIGAVAYSSEARSKVQAAGGTALSIRELLKTHPDGKGVRLLA
jgi:large subunit ribosomal protein L18e